ncbi:MAG: NAD-dependent epimerase/dehydratase family protein [Candidatus Saccharimonadales bacterium]
MTETLQPNPNTENTRQAILGATGDIGSLLLNELVNEYDGVSVRAVSRTLPEVDNRHDGVEYRAADVENLDDLVEVTRGMDVVYSTLAVPYNTEAWTQSWPRITENVIEAARTNGFKLVFLDNVYMYGKADGPMTEDTPVNPASGKGKVRAEVADMLLQAMESGEINATIGRSADFYGPDSRISSRFFQGALKEGKAYWMGNPDVMRTWSYTPDNAKALAILGNDARADKKVWHMPVAPAMKGVGFIALASKVLGKDLETIPVPGDDAEARKAFAANMPEIADMMYQYDNNFVVDSSRFQRTFGMEPTSYEEGFRNTFDILAKSK